MSTTTDKLFNNIAQKVRSEAAKVPCSTQEYIDGLTAIIDELKIAKDSAESDLRIQDKKNEA